MEHNSFFQRCNYSNRDDKTDARTGWSLCPVQDIDTVFNKRYGVNVNVDDTLSFLYCDLYLRQQLKHTMLLHESVFESQIHELHRLYRRQKELMMEMERTRHHSDLYLNSSFLSSRTHWMNSSVSTYQTRRLPYEENIPDLMEDNVEKSEKLPEQRSSMKGEEVHEAPKFLKEQSLRSMSLESGNQLNKLQLDLNEPAKIEEDSDYVLNQFLSPVTSNDIGEDSVKCSNVVNEAQGSVQCEEEYEIDLNMSPLSSEEEVTIVKKFETKKPQESSLSVSSHEKHGSKQSRVIVQGLPCSTSILLSDKRCKPRKVKLSPSNETFIRSDIDLLSSAKVTSGSQSNEASIKKGRSSSLLKEKSARNQTNPGKKRRRKPQMKSSKGHKVVVKKSGRIKRKKSRRISLVTEENYQEISAAEAIVVMSRKSSQETADCITSLSRNLLWLAEVSSTVAEDYEMDYVEAMSLQLTKKKLVEHSSDNKVVVSSIVLGKQRRSRVMQGKRKFKDGQRDDEPSLGTVSECKANEDLQVLGKLIEACGFPKNKRRRSPCKSKYAVTSSVEEKTSIDWGDIKKRRRGSRLPAADFKNMIINQLV